MRLSKIKLIFQKEILDTLRDRRTLITMILVPLLLYPGIMMLVTSLAMQQQQKMERKRIDIAVVNVPDDSLLVKRLRSEKQINIVSSENPFEAVREGNVLFVLQGPSNLNEILDRKQSAEIQLLYDRANEDAGTNLDRIKRIVEECASDILKQRLAEKELTQQYVEPLTLKEVNVASKQKMGGFAIGRILPMLMVFMILVGSLYPSIDMTAGEKERGTLETILTSPATRSEIVIGKFLTVSLIALITGLLNLGSMMATFTYGLFREVMEALQINIPFSYLMIMLLCMVPLAIFFSGVMMAIASFATSFKEAQNMVTPFYLVATFPAMVSSIPGIRLEGFWMTVPIANVTLLFKELMLGVFDWNHLLIVFFSSTFFASVAIFLAIKLFGREEVLFGESASFRLSLRRANIAAKPVPAPSESLFFAMISLCLLIYIGLPLQARDIVSGLIFTEVVLFFLVPVAFAHYMKLDLKHTFSLRLPVSKTAQTGSTNWANAAKFFAITLLMFAGIEMTIGTILYVQTQIMPFPEELKDLMERVMREFYGRPFWQTLALLAFLPAVCEETTFRGLVLSGMINRKKQIYGVLITSFLFAVFHLSLHRFLAVFLIGFGASYLVWKSRSIFTGVLLHMMCNGYISFVSVYPRYDWLQIQNLKPNIPAFLAGAAVITAVIYWIRRETVE